MKWGRGVSLAGIYNTLTSQEYDLHRALEVLNDKSLESAEATKAADEIKAHPTATTDKYCIDCTGQIRGTNSYGAHITNSVVARYFLKDKHFELVKD